MKKLTLYLLLSIVINSIGFAITDNYKAEQISAENDSLIRQYSNKVEELENFRFNYNNSLEISEIVRLQDSLNHLQKILNQLLYSEYLILKEKVTKTKKLENTLKEELSKSNDLSNVLFITVGSSILFLSLFFVGVIQQKKLIKNERLIFIINKKLKKSVNQKETLLRELNHRVKNNLSILSSLLFLQQRRLKSQEAKEALENSITRINSISLIHETLYNNSDLDLLNLNSYLEKMIQYLRTIYWDAEKQLDIQINCSQIKPNLTDSIPIVMIFNELITNSFKYAFHDNPYPSIEVKSTHKSFSYSDNGPGFILNKESKEGLGLKLIDLFCKQLEINYSTEKKGDRLYHNFQFIDGD